MDWNEYKSLCDAPFTFSRWMLEQTLELTQDDAHLADALAAVLRGPALPKPSDHRGGPATDMFEVWIELELARAIHRSIQHAVLAGHRTRATRERGLGGFDAAWRDYVTLLANKRTE